MSSVFSQAFVSACVFHASKFFNMLFSFSQHVFFRDYIFGIFVQLCA